MAFHEFFEIDQKTGFLTPKSNCRVKNGFTASQKVEWLKFFRSSANYGSACKLVGTDRSTVRDHLKGDTKFGQEHKKAVEDICDDMEQCLFELAKRNPTAAFGVLKAYRPKIWRERYVEKGPNKDERLKGLLDSIKSEGSTTSGSEETTND